MAHGVVVAVEGDIERAVGDGLALLDPGHLRGEAGGERFAAPENADEHDVLRALIALHDLVGDARQRPAHLARVHHLSFRRRHFRLFPSARAKTPPADGEAGGVRFACTRRHPLLGLGTPSGHPWRERRHGVTRKLGSRSLPASPDGSSKGSAIRS